MEIYKIKYKLEKPLKSFVSYIILASSLLAYVIITGFEKWIIGFIPTVILLSLIGSFIISKTIISLTSYDDEVEGLNEKELEHKFLGVEGVQKLFYVIVVMVYIGIYYITSLYGYNMFDGESMNIIVTMVMVLVTLVLTYETLNKLTFVIFFVSIILGMTKGAKARKVIEEVKNIEISEDYDVDENIKKLICKYAERIDWYEKHLKEESSYKGKIEAYESILSDLDDFVKGINL
ncbi:hypothetical protein MKA27_12980 [[Clostridium] innocuum]|uniref:hypothetical protein n=1 Tax=Clostridium innocuum TaxID=1522 RepID=UPI000D6A9438|nr:hypothetical protein [[Clostridium] innocuum]MCR0315477.1 hypothetical protein [[Clostridium] innocuum]MCR0369757.1 hypothetical protein [[Clostridium] innocuum]MCR0374732.1 hypothetical protein [[Clostridium] innocuum]MCR0559710.1 hypothetical protein [[Clostridium] innocuum]MCR0602596.1 hypothetical protein [[Clostridium] innocuum]